MIERSPVGTPSDMLPLREVLDGDLDRGTALFDSDLALVYANPAARAFLHPPEGAIVMGIREAIARYRDRLGRSPVAPPPAELTVGTDTGRRARATISLLSRAAGAWFVVRLAAPGTFSEPSVRRLQSRFRLTLREAQVAMCVARGQANGEIATELGIREKTVKNALMAVFLKCRVRNRVELALKAHDAPVGDEE